jgi:hypothetical protein
MTLVINLPWPGRRRRTALYDRAFAVPYASLRRTRRPA